MAFVLLALPLGAMVFVSACSGDDSGNDGGADATPDVTRDVQRLDTGPDVLDAGCATDVDLTQYLPSADASIDVDAGGVNIAACTGCLKTSCGTNINACNQDCDCRTGVVNLVTCIAGGNALNNCAQEALLSGNQTLQNLVGCAAQNCISACIPPDGGMSSGDAAADASADASDDGG